jgi:hypothetical protein
VIGPIVGGILIGMHVPLQQLFLIAAIPLVIGLINAIILTPFYRAEWAGHGGRATGQPSPAAGDD